MEQRNASRNGYFVNYQYTQKLKYHGELNNIVSKPEQTMFSSGRVVGGKYIFALPNDALFNLVSKPISSGVAQMGSICFLGTNDNKIHAVDVLKKRLLWSHKIKGNVKSDPLFYANMVYFLSEAGQLLAIDIEKGKVNWGYSFKGKASAAPTLVKGFLVVGDHKGQINAFDWKSGKILWTNRLASPIKGSITIQNEDVFAATESGFLYCLKLKKGNILWQKKLNGSSLTSLACNGSKVVIGTQKGFLHVFSNEGKEYFYSPIDLNAALMTPIISDEMVYVANENTFYQVNLLTGKKDYQYSIPVGRPIRPPVYGNGIIYLNTLSLKNKKVSASVTHQFKFDKLQKPKVLSIPIINDISSSDNIQKEFLKAAKLKSKYTYNRIEHDFTFECDFLSSQSNLYLYARIGDPKPNNSSVKRDGVKTTEDAFSVYVIPENKDQTFYEMHISQNKKLTSISTTLKKRNYKWEIHTRPMVKEWIVDKKKVGWTLFLSIPWASMNNMNLKNKSGKIKILYRDVPKKTKGKAHPVFYYVGYPGGRPYKIGE